VVLTDIEMPDMNGFEFAETIQGRYSTLNTMPIIALSSMVSPAAIESAAARRLPRLRRQVRPSRPDSAR